MNPADVILGAIDSLSTEAAQSDVTLITDLSPTLARSASLDPARFQQILWNLVSNAIKFSPKGGTVRIESSSDADTLYLRVSDSGRGIAPDFLPLLFDRFTQSEDANRRKHGGLGLGLSIVKQLAELHGGAVSVFSEGEGKGATFTVMIPLSERANIETRAERNEVRTPEHGRSLNGLDVLIVEDDEDAAAALSAILIAYGAGVRTARDFDGALGEIARSNPDLIISDIGLPGRDGIDLIRQIRAREIVASRSRVPAIALTAFTRQQDRRAAMEAGFDAVCGKPLRMGELLEAIEAGVGR